MIVTNGKGDTEMTQLKGQLMRSPGQFSVEERLSACKDKATGLLFNKQVLKKLIKVSSHIDGVEEPEAKSPQM
jgi:hypothetical protein